MSNKDKSIVEKFKQECTFDEFWAEYEDFHDGVLKNGNKYLDFAESLLSMDAKQPDWKKAFILSLNLTKSLTEDSKSIMNKMVDILETNMDIFPNKEDERKRFIVLDVCIDILEIMCKGNRIHYPAALYDVLQKTNIESSDCNEFYGKNAETEVINRTYDVLKKMGMLEQLMKPDQYTETYKINFAEKLELTFLRSNEEEEKKRKTKKRRVIVVGIVISLCVICAVLTKIAGGWQSRLQEQEEQIKRLNVHSEEIKSNNEVLQEENDKLKEELEKKQQPEQPEQPKQPEQPEQPEQSEQPKQPEQPEQPEQSAQKEQAGQKETSGQKEQPEQKGQEEPVETNQGE